MFKFKNAVAGSGFQMEGYYVWCGSMIKEGDTYYLFAARWPKEYKFPEGYLNYSEIVLATTKDLAKPFQFEKVLITKREGDYWDSAMAHNPYIFRTEEGYALYYIGSPDGGVETRAIGFATSKSLTDGWVRSDKAFVLPQDANNPCPVQTPEGDWLLYFRDTNCHVSVARGKSYKGPFEVVAYDLYPEGGVEDMFIYWNGQEYVMIAEDCVGAYTGLGKGGLKCTSKDGIHWPKENIEQAYDFHVKYNDGSELVLQRRERPTIFFDGDRQYLVTTAKINGENQWSGGDTWNMIQEIEVE